MHHKDKVKKTFGLHAYVYESMYVRVKENLEFTTGTIDSSVAG